MTTGVGVEDGKTWKRHVLFPGFCSVLTLYGRRLMVGNGIRSRMATDYDALTDNLAIYLKGRMAYIPQIKN